MFPKKVNKDCPFMLTFLSSSNTITFQSIKSTYMKITMQSTNSPSQDPTIKNAKKLFFKFFKVFSRLLKKKLKFF